MSSIAELYQIADELRGIASGGLWFCTNEYDRDRYKRIIAAAARIVGVLEERSPDEILERFEDDLFHVTPAAGTDAAVFRNEQVLLIRRSDNGLWALPGGAVEMGETLAEAACRELWEEAGIRGRATRLLGVWDNRLCGTRSKIHANCFVFLVETKGGTPTPGPEAVDAGYFGVGNLPPLDISHKVIVPMVFRLVGGEIPSPYFDSPETNC